MTCKIDFPEKNDIARLVELDNEIFGHDIAEEIEASVSTYEEWYDINRYQWLVAKDEEGNIQGYINIYHITKDAFERLVEGEISEKDFKTSDFVKFGKQEKIHCNIDGFVVRNKDSRTAISLLNKLVKYFRFLKENNIEVEKVLAVAITNEGKKLCEKVGFEKYREEKSLSDGNKPIVYVLDFGKSSFSRTVNAIKEIFLESHEYFE